MTKNDLSQAIWSFAKEHSGEELVGVLSKALIGLAHASGADELNFEDDIGTVIVTCNSVPEAQ